MKKYQSKVKEKNDDDDELQKRSINNELIIDEHYLYFSHTSYMDEKTKN